MSWIESFFDANYATLLREEQTVEKTRLEVDFIQEVLDLSPGSRVLDVACGFGRHVTELARRGHQAVGADFSRAMLRGAKQHRRARFVRADMRQLPFDEEFDAVTNIFTSFGYFSHRDNLRALRRMAAALEPGGLLFVDTRDRRYDEALHRSRGETYRWWSETHKRVTFEEIAYEQKRGVAHVTWHVMRLSERRRFTKSFDLRVYYRGEWNAMLRECGLSRVAVFNDWQGNSDARQPGPRLILVARKNKN